jgi:hypothetical protein
MPDLGSEYPIYNPIISTIWTFAGIEPIYLSYFVPWSGFDNMERARDWGFKTLNDTGEWKREGYIEQYDQIDSKGYLVHPWLKYPKFGHARTTDVASNWIREGIITRDEGIQLVREHDHKLDPQALEDFLSFTGYNVRDFWKLVDILIDRGEFVQCDPDEATLMGKYKLKNPIWEEWYEAKS